MPIDIPNKCPEDWSNMTQTSIGRHCANCQIEVVDFTNWNVDDIIAYVRRSPTKVCGRITKDQSSPNHRFMLWNSMYFTRIGLGMMLSGLLLSTTANGKTYIGTAPAYMQVQLVIKDSVIIMGTITDSSKIPLAGAMVYNNLTNAKISADTVGRFCLRIPRDLKAIKVKLTFKCVGYQAKDIVHDLSVTTPLIIVLEPQVNEMGEIIVWPYRRFKSLPKKKKN